MINLLVRGLEPLLAVPFDSKITLYKVLVDGGIPLEPGAREQAEVVDDGVGYLRVVEPLQKKLFRVLRRVLYHSCQVLGQADCLCHHVVEEPWLEPANGCDEVVEGGQPRDLLS